MNTAEARTIIKSINRRCRRGKMFGRDRYGADFSTWSVCYPQTSRAYVEAAKIITGRDGRFMPPKFGNFDW